MPASAPSPTRSNSERGRCFAAALVAVACWVVAEPTPAQTRTPLCPQKSVRLLVGFPPGGGTDVYARLLAHELSAYFGQQFVVENRPGAAGSIAAEALLNARPDGCTWLVVSAAFASATAWTAGGDPLANVAPVTRIAQAPNLLVVHPSLPVRDARAFVDFVRARPGDVPIGTAGNGTVSHLAVELLKARVPRLQPVIVPYKGNGPAILDLVSGEISALFATTPGLVTHLANRRLRALAVASAQRTRLLPDLPTLAEAGIDGVDATSWSGIVAHAATDYDRITRLQVAVGETLKSRTFVARLSAQGADPVGDTADDFRVFLRAEIERWSRLGRALGTPRSRLDVHQSPRRSTA